MTFKVCNLGSKCPYFNRAYVVRGYLFFATTVYAMFYELNDSLCRFYSLSVNVFSELIWIRFNEDFEVK